MAQEDFCQLDTHAPSAGELGAGAVEVFAFEAESNDGAVHFGDTACLFLLRSIGKDGGYILA